MKTRMDRRHFIAGAALGGAGLLILRNSASARSYRANAKLNVALVGAGGRGSHFLGAIARVGENLVAVCDVNEHRLAERLKSLPEARKYQDFRKMLEEMDRQIDAVVVATPPHTHAVIGARAMKRGKHVYIEKPMAHDVGEARALRQIARERKVATQMGSQGMATDSFRRTLELIQEGAVGEIREAHVWFEFGGSGPLERPKESPPVPEHVDWDLFLGPAPFRPYHPGYVSPGYGLSPTRAFTQGWSKWRDFSTGCIGGGGAHSINMTFKALNLKALWDAGEAPGTIRVETEVSESCPENFPRWQTVQFDVPARGPLPPARIHWYNAWLPELKRQGIWQRLEKIAGGPPEWGRGWAPHSGSLLVGAKGVVHSSAHNSQNALLPEKNFPDISGPPKKLPRSGSHEREWIQACKGAPMPTSNFDHSGPVQELLLLGNVASLVGGPLEFDPIACKIVNNDEADRALRPPRREGWSL